MRRRAVFALLASLLLFCLLGCEGKALTETEVRGWLTGDGVTLLGPSGSILDIPAQPGLDHPVELSLSQVASEVVPTLNGERRLGVGFLVKSAEPITFSPAARVTLRYAKQDLSEQVQQTQLAAYRCEGPWYENWPIERQPVRTWTKLDNGIAKTSTHDYQADTTSVGLFTVFVPESAFGADGDADLAEESESEADAESEEAAASDGDAIEDEG